jgi:cytochrome c-type biogenesis protein CcmE
MREAHDLAGRRGYADLFAGVGFRLARGEAVGPRAGRQRKGPSFMTARYRRIAWIAAGLAVLGVAVALELNAFQSNIVFFFSPTRTARAINVIYQGILPDLFKEGKGVVAQGKLGPDVTFVASEVLARHDEN